MNILYNILSLTEPNMLDGATLFLCQSLVQILYSCGTCSFFGFESENNNKLLQQGYMFQQEILITHFYLLLWIVFTDILGL